MRNHRPHRPPHRQATSLAYLGLEGSNPCFLFLLAIFLLLMPLPLHRTVAPRPCLVPDWRPLSRMDFRLIEECNETRTKGGMPFRVTKKDKPSKGCCERE